MSKYIAFKFIELETKSNEDCVILIFQVENVVHVNPMDLHVHGMRYMHVTFWTSLLEYRGTVGIAAVVSITSRFLQGAAASPAPK